MSSLSRHRFGCPFLSQKGRAGGGALAALALALLALQFVPFPASGAGGEARAGGKSVLDRRQQLENESEQARQRLEQYQRQLHRNRARARGVEQNVSVLNEERARLNRMLIDNAREIQFREASLTSLENRLRELAAQEKLVRGSLARRHGRIAALLASMQRIGRHPPPVIITRRQDALKMVRSAMLLGSLYPQLKKQADRLAAKLTELVRIETSISRERRRFVNERNMLKSNRKSMKILLARKRARLAARQSQLASLRAAARLNQQNVNNISELIKRLSKKIEKLSRLGQYEKDLKSGKAGGGVRRKAFANPGRMQPAVAFYRTRGLLPMPVAGERVRSFGQRNDFGAISKGIVIKTRPSAQVTSPCDGWVVYAGPFRSYGNLLIINAGGGYHVLLAGMKRIDAALGQFILAGEPVGMMKGEEAATSANGGEARLQNVNLSGKKPPLLYIEFRRKGRPVNPDPWWSRKRRMARK